MESEEEDDKITLAKDQKLVDVFKQKALDDEIKDLMALLKLVSKIQANEKICFSSRQILPAHSFTTALRRMWDKESRNITLDRLNNLLNTFRTIYTNPVISKISKAELLDDLNKSQNGVFNLCTTYNDDRNFIAKLEVWIREVNTLIQEYSRKLE